MCYHNLCEFYIIHYSVMISDVLTRIGSGIIMKQKNPHHNTKVVSMPVVLPAIISGSWWMGRPTVIFFLRVLGGVFSRNRPVQLDKVDHRDLFIPGLPGSRRIWDVD